MVEEAFNGEPPVPGDDVLRPAALSNRVYSAEAVDAYVVRLHDHAGMLQQRIDELEAEVAARATSPVSFEENGGAPRADAVLVAARREAAMLLEAARAQAAEVLAEGERLAARAVIRALERIDSVVREWAASDPTPPPVLDVRHGVANGRH
jgi:cell division septum initiation protein DivIVA